MSEEKYYQLEKNNKLKEQVVKYDYMNPSLFFKKTYIDNVEKQSKNIC